MDIPVEKTSNVLSHNPYFLKTSVTLLMASSMALTMPKHNNYIGLHCIVLYCITLQNFCVVLYFISLYCIFIALYCIVLH